MRTTLSLDDDVAAALRHAQRRSGRGWKEVVNETLRAGLASEEPERGSRPGSPARTPAVRLGRPRTGDVANVHAVLSLADGEGRR